MNHVPDVQMSSHLAALRGLFLVALHHGVQVPPENFAAADEADTVGSLLRLMRDIGLSAKLLSGRNWEQLTHLGSAYPAMAERKDGNWVIVASAMPSTDGDTAVAVLDPRNEKAGVALDTTRTLRGAVDRAPDSVQAAVHAD